jgi:hypothetical protein
MNAAQLARLQGYWTRMPGRVSVTFKNQTSPGTYATETLTDCWKRLTGLAEADVSLGVYCSELVDWFVPKAKLAASPTPGDVIEYGGNSYVVMPDGVTEAGAQGAWRVATGRFFLQSGLTDTITIWRPQPGKDSFGRQTRGTPTAVLSDAPAKIQDVNTFGTVPLTAADTLGKFQNPQIFRCYFSGVIRVQPHDWVEDQDGVKYSIRGDFNVEKLGELMSLMLERLR